MAPIPKLERIYTYAVELAIARHALSGCTSTSLQSVSSQSRCRFIRL
jgi:hypothetical protein